MNNDRRLEFHKILVEILGNDNVYFQPPNNVKMKYPCIVYSRSQLDIKHANNHPFLIQQRYQLTVIDSDPDSELLEKITKIPSIQFNRHYTADNMNHDVYNIFY